MSIFCCVTGHTHLIPAGGEAGGEEGVGVLEGLDLHVLDDGGADLVLEVVPGEAAAQPLDQVVEEDLDVAAPGKAAQVEVAARVGQGALMSPPEIQRDLRVFSWKCARSQTCLVYSVIQYLEPI